MRATVVIPTYNERDNIAQLLSAIRAVAPDLHVLVVDDNSPDGTGALVDQLSAHDERVRALRRPGRLGYGTAVADGMARALAEGAGLVLTMDADFSHDPKHLPELLLRAEECEVVVGSRYVPGGGTRNWGLLRRALSAGANLVARALLGLPVHDCTGGFRCYHRAVVERINPSTIAVEGYGFLTASLFRCHRAGYRLGEVPIIFEDRRFGQSKLSKRIIVEAVGVVFRLFLERLTGRRVRGL